MTAKKDKKDALHWWPLIQWHNHQEQISTSTHQTIFEPLWHAKYFIKPDLHNPYHLIRIKEDDSLLTPTLKNSIPLPSSPNDCAMLNKTEKGNLELLSVNLALNGDTGSRGRKFSFSFGPTSRTVPMYSPTKQLNSRQACWSLFLRRFKFTLFYRPWSEALPRLYSPDSAQYPVTIFPSLCIVGAATWQMKLQSEKPSAHNLTLVPVQSIVRSCLMLYILRGSSEELN